MARIVIITLVFFIGVTWYAKTEIQELRASAKGGVERNVQEMPQRGNEPWTDWDSRIMEIGSRGKTGGIRLDQRTFENIPQQPLHSNRSPSYFPCPSFVQMYTVTAYSPNEESTGKYPGHPEYKITATGTTATEGRTIAADFAVLPSGSIVEIEGIGLRVVEDCGGAVNGRHIDVYMEDTNKAVKFGKQQRKVRVIRYGAN